MVYRLGPWFHWINENIDVARLPPAYFTGTSPPVDPQMAPDGHPQALDWTGELTWTKGGTAIIRGEKPDSTYHKVKD